MQSAVVSKAKWQEDGEGTWICFQVPRDTAAGMMQSMSGGKDRLLVLRPYRKKRSLDANGYFWSLVSALSVAVGSSPTEIYREYIRDIGGNSYIVPVKEELVNEFCDLWCEGHRGRMAEDIGPCRNTEGYHNIRVYIGSSDYDTKQMSRLIDLAIADCKECGIDTLTPEERERLLKEWDNGS